jgi:hypothetical protein
MSFRSRRRSAPVLVAFVLAAVLTGISVTPAAAAPTAAAELAYCNPLAPAGGSTFSTFSLLGASGIAGRGGEIREPDLGEVHEDLPAGAKGNADAGFEVTVPVWFHVVSDGRIGNIPDRVIAAQMRVLNLAFGGFYGGVASGFSFELVGVTRTDNAAWHYAGSNGTHANEMKRALHRGGPETLNVYATTAGAFLGWAYLPSIVESPSQAYLDGIVVDWESMPGASDTYEDEFDLGQTATHEAGHWLNLEHTFYGGCNRFGDFVEDTPPMKTPTSGCPEGKDTCREAGLDPIHNYMDYSHDSCYSEFSAGQVQRMHDAWLHWRA